MHDFMSPQTKSEVLSQLRRQYRRAGRAYKRQLLSQAIQLLGYHRKAAIRALRQRPKAPATSALILGRPRAYHPETLLPILKPIWFAAFQPCGSRLAALLPEWLPASEADHRRLDADVRESLLAVSARTLDRLLAPLRVSRRRRGGTKPGSLLRQSIPIRGAWTEDGPGWLELDTVALCGGTLDDRHLWMLDAVDKADVPAPHPSRLGPGVMPTFSILNSRPPATNPCKWMERWTRCIRYICTPRRSSCLQTSAPVPLFS